MAVNLPNSPNARTVQGPGPTGQEGYPIATVPASGADPWPIAFSTFEPVNLFPSSAQTTDQVSAVQTNLYALGVLIFLDLTVSPGSSARLGLEVQVQARDTFGSFYRLNGKPQASRNSGDPAGRYLYVIFPGSSSPPLTVADGRIVQATAVPLPRYWRVTVHPLDALSYTYSLDYVYLR